MLGENVQGMLREMMMKADLDPDDKEESMVSNWFIIYLQIVSLFLLQTTPTGIGNMSARKLMKLKEQDGLNPTGTDGGVKYNKKIYKPTLNYQPVNRPGESLGARQSKLNINTDFRFQETLLIQAGGCPSGSRLQCMECLLSKPL